MTTITKTIEIEAEIDLDDVVANCAPQEIIQSFGETADLLDVLAEAAAGARSPVTLHQLRTIASHGDTARFIAAVADYAWQYGVFINTARLQSSHPRIAA